VRVSSSINNANFTADGVDAAIRNLPADAKSDEALEVEKLVDQFLVPVCSPAFVERYGPFTSPDMLKGVPLIHDDSLSSRAVMPTWTDWFAAAGVRDADVSHGLRFNTADHALDATVEGAGVLLAGDVLAYDDLRTGRLVMPFDLTQPSGRCYSFVCPKKRRDSANVQVFRAWLREEAAALDRSKLATRAADLRPAAGSPATRHRQR
jgi:LysR family transcriptional regulator, glycine cleavage system transcriptional activator